MPLAAFPDRGDQFVLTHPRGALDAGPIGQCAQFGQHHGGQRTVRPALVLASVADPDASWSAEESVVTELDSLWFSVLSSAVTRSVSVTDFLSSLADRIKPGVRCIQPNRRVLPTIDSATVIPHDLPFKWRTIVPEKNLVFVLVSTQTQRLQLLDAVENNLLRCRKQEAPPSWRSTLAADSYPGSPAYSVADWHLADRKPVCGAVLEGLCG